MKRWNPHIVWTLWLVLLSWASILTVRYFCPSAIVAILLSQWMLVLSDLVVGLRLEIRSLACKKLAQVLVLGFWGLSIYHGFNLATNFYHEELLVRSASELVGALVLYVLLPIPLGTWLNSKSLNLFIGVVGMNGFAEIISAMLQNNPRFFRSENRDESWKLMKYIEFRQKALTASYYLYFCPYLIFTFLSFIIDTSTLEFLTILVFAVPMIVVPIAMFVSCIARAMDD